MSKLPLITLPLTVDPALTEPAEILNAVAMQFQTLTGGVLDGAVRTNQFWDRLVTHDLDVIRLPQFPIYGLLTAEHAPGASYPVYVVARCFGDVWSPPPLGPHDSSLKIAPCAGTPAEFLALVNEVLASPNAWNVFEHLLYWRDDSADSNGADRNGQTDTGVRPAMVDLAAREHS